MIILNAIANADIVPRLSRKDGTQAQHHDLLPLPEGECRKTGKRLPPDDPFSSPLIPAASVSTPSSIMSPGTSMSCTWGDMVCISTPTLTSMTGSMIRRTTSQPIIHREPLARRRQETHTGHPRPSGSHFRGQDVRRDGSRLYRPRFDGR